MTKLEIQRASIEALWDRAQELQREVITCDRELITDNRLESVEIHNAITNLWMSQCAMVVLRNLPEKDQWVM